MITIMIYCYQDKIAVLKCTTDKTQVSFTDSHHTGRCVFKIMSLSPQLLLSKAIRDRCVAKSKDIPNFGTSSSTKTLQFASVLIPMCVRDEKVHILYTLRSSKLKHHSGQVSFPGGKMDDGESIVDAALRETEEQIGVHRDAVDVWNVMPNVRGSNKELVVTPVVGVIRNFNYDKLIPNKTEVDEIFTVPIESLCSTNTHAHFMFGKLAMPLYLFEKHKIWGITGLATHMFLTSLLPKEQYCFNFNSPKYHIEELN